MILAILWAAFLLWVILAVGQGRFLPWLNRNIFSRIWNEEIGPFIERETIDHLKSLLENNDLPEEAAISLAAKRQGLTDKELLNAFNAWDARDLIRILSAKNPGLGALVLKRLGEHHREGMRRRP